MSDELRNQPLTRDDVLLTVGSKVFTHSRQEKRDSEVVYIYRGQVVVREHDGGLQATSAWLCWGRDEAMLLVQRECKENWLDSLREMQAQAPAVEARIVELNAAIAAIAAIQAASPTLTTRDVTQITFNQMEK